MRLREDGFLRRLPLVVISAVLSATFFSTTVTFAADTPSLGYPNMAQGDCWQQGTPLTCVSNHVGTRGPVHFRAIDQISGTFHSKYYPALNDSVNMWQSAPGPQYYSFSAVSGDIWTYMKDGYYGGSAGGFTVICDYIRKNSNGSPYCQSDQEPFDIWYSTVYLNDSYGGQSWFGYANLRYTWGHEMGHSMGLYHNTTDSRAIMWANTYATTQTEDASDTGVYPGCANGGHGLSCIYGWGR